MSARPALRALCAILPALLAVCTSPAHAQPFTYQGSLTSGGLAASGTFDFQFTVRTAATGGAQVGTVTNAAFTAVDAGTFTATVDPGSGVFTGADRWLEIAVRPSGSGPYTTLSPRQKIAAVPYAARALSERWNASGSTITNDPATSTRVLVNRTSPLTSAEYFGFTSTAPAGFYGGMYNNTTDVAGLPFYGYATAGDARAWTYYNHADTSWRVNISGDRLAVTASGKVGINTTTPDATLTVEGTARASGTVSAGNFTYTAPRARSYNITADEFRPANSTVSGVFGQGPFYRAYLDDSVGPGELYAALHLPQGAVITGVHFYMYSSVPIAVFGEVYRRPFDSLTTVTVATGAATTSTGQFVTGTLNPANTTIDNDQYVYGVRVSCSDWRGDLTNVRQVRVFYTVPAPE